MKRCHGVPQTIKPQPLPAARRETLNAAKFWTLMERWQIPSDRALNTSKRLRSCTHGRPWRHDTYHGRARPLTEERDRLSLVISEVRGRAGRRGVIPHVPDSGAPQAPPTEIQTRLSSIFVPHFRAIGEGEHDACPNCGCP